MSKAELISRLKEYRRLSIELEEKKTKFDRDMAQMFLSARKELGLSQRELAARLGVSFPYISKIENGHMIPGEDLLVRFMLLMEESNEKQG